jgi:hypothetical protein
VGRNKGSEAGMFKFIGKLLGHETPLWLSILAFTVTGLIAWFGPRFSADDARANDHRLTQVRALIDSMNDFQVYSAAYATEMLASKAAAPNSQGKLLENINLQVSKIRALESRLSPDEKQLVIVYRSQLLKVSESVNSSKDIVSMKNYWASVAVLTDSKRKLLDKLQRES